MWLIAESYSLEAVFTIVLVNMLWLHKESCLLLAKFVIVLANTCCSCYLWKERICFSYCSSINHIFYPEDDWLITSFCFKVASCSFTYLTRSVLVCCSLSSLPSHHVLSSLSYHYVLQELHPPPPSWCNCQLFYLPSHSAASIGWYWLILGPRPMFQLQPSWPSFWGLPLSPRWASAHMWFVGGLFWWVIVLSLTILVTDRLYLSSPWFGSPSFSSLLPGGFLSGLESGPFWWPLLDVRGEQGISKVRGAVT